MRSNLRLELGPKGVAIAIATICIGLATQAAAGETLTYPDLARRMYDLRYLAEPPQAGESSGAATSGDRASRYDAAKDVYVDWHANADGSGFVRCEGDNIVAAELEGPGVIWRIWSAKPENGPIRFFIDGAEQPALDVPFKKLFDAKDGPFPFPELVRNMAGGWNCFVPIPYQKSCKVVLGKDWGAYFQFTYTRFSAGTNVPSFRGSLGKAETLALSEADRIWKDRGDPAVEPHSAVVEADLPLEPHQAANPIKLDGPRAITGIVCSLSDTKPAEIERALREITLSITWDGDEQPSVWCPLGDFFGSAPGINPFRALPAGMTRDAMYASWYMPFGSKAAVKLTNDGAAARRIKLKLIHEPLTKPADKLLRFHAKWHRDHYGAGGVGRFAKDRYPDWPVLFADGGPGRFCGMHLHVWNPLHAWDTASASRFIQKPSELCGDHDWFRREVVGNKYWYGEGDEKFFVDGEKYPSTIGTGTEDYFGFAWGTPQRFDSATQCQTRNTNNTGHISLVRWQIADNVPFQKSFEADIEKYHGNNWPLLYAATAYWYQAPGVVDEYQVVSVKDRVAYYALPELKPLVAPNDGVYEGEQHFLAATGAAVREQDMKPFGKHWRGDAQLLWDGKPGEQLDLSFAVSKPFSGRVQVQLTLAPDYGKFEILLDGKSVAQDVDCYAPEVRLAALVDLADINLAAGKHTLSFKITGANDAARKFKGSQYLLGVDYVKIDPR